MTSPTPRTSRCSEPLAGEMGTPSSTRQPVAAAVGLCLIAIAVSLVLRVVYLSQPWRIDASVPAAFLTAEGLVGLMGRHIVRGARPVFYYGQFYLGAFEAYLAALAFKVFGASMTTLRVVPTVSAVMWVPLTGAVAWQLYGRRAGLLAATIIALPSPFVFEWGFIAWGGHAHVTLMLLALNLLVLVLQRATPLRLATLGFVSGFAVWVNQLAVPYLAVVGFVAFKWLNLRRKDLALLVAAGVIGLSPLVYGNVVQPLATARNLVFRVRSSWRLSARLIKQTDDEHRYYRSLPLFQVLGAQPHRDGSWSATGSAVALLLALGGIAQAWHGYRSRAQDPLAFRRVLVVLGFLGVSLGVGITGFFGQPVARYQILLYPLLGVLATGWIEQAGWHLATAAVALVALVQVRSILTPGPPEARTPATAVIAALTQRGLSHGYGADYCYDLVFESGERLLIEPLGWSKFAPYESAVATADRVFYLYRDDQQQKTSHQVFMEYLSHAGIRSQRLDAGDYHALYDFEPRESLSGPAIAKLREAILTRKER